MVQDPSATVGSVAKMTVEIEWVLGALILVIGSIMSFLLAMVMRVARKVNTHELTLTTVKTMDGKLDGIVHEMDRVEIKAEGLFAEAGKRLERHELREESQFKDINRSIQDLTVHVALLVGHPLNEPPIKDKTNA